MAAWIAALTDRKEMVSSSWWRLGADELARRRERGRGMYSGRVPAGEVFERGGVDSGSGGGGGGTDGGDVGAKEREGTTT